MAQVQITKPAAKTAAKTAPVKTAKPAATKTKTAAKTEARTKTAPATKTEAKPAELHYIKDSFRPGSGAPLFAYTMAWLQASGLIDGGSIDRAAAVKFAGSTAIGYHTNKTGRMVDKDGRISLAAGGANFFADRHHSADQREAFANILKTGQPDGTNVKTAAGIGKI